MKQLCYPFDPAYIMQNRRALRAELIADGTPRIKKKIAVLGGSTTNDICRLLELFLLDETAVQKGKHGKQQCEHQCEHAEGSVFDFFLRGWMFHIGYSLTVISCNGNYTTLYTSGEDFSR